MISIILSACVLSFLTVAVHATGIAILVRSLIRHHPPTTSAWLILRMLLRMIWWLVLLHLVEISIWGLFYLWHGCLPNGEAAFYFSGSTYTTLGYGDVVLPKPWRMLGPIESLMGVLMCGLSTGYFFVVVSRIHQSRPVLAPRMHRSVAIRASVDESGRSRELSVCRQEKKAFEKPTKDCGCMAGKPEVVPKRAFGEVMALGRNTP